MAQFGLYSDFKMTLQEVNRVANLPEWTTVLEMMIISRRADLVFRTTKQERWNQRAQEHQAHNDFLEEHRGTDKFSGNYTLQPQQTEVVWTVPCDCWIELENKDMHCKEWECMLANFTEEEANTTVHRIYVTLSAAGSLGAVTTQCIKWVLSGRSAAEQMQKWQQALQADQITDAGLKRVSPLSAFQVTETNEVGMMVITTTRVTQMHDIVKSL